MKCLFKYVAVICFFVGTHHEGFAAGAVVTRGSSRAVVSGAKVAAKAEGKALSRWARFKKFMRPKTVQELGDEVANLKTKHDNLWRELKLKENDFKQAAKSIKVVQEDANLLGKKVKKTERYLEDEKLVKAYFKSTRVLQDMRKEAILKEVQYLEKKRSELLKSAKGLDASSEQFTAIKKEYEEINKKIEGVKVTYKEDLKKIAAEKEQMDDLLLNLGLLGMVAGGSAYLMNYEPK